MFRKTSIPRPSSFDTSNQMSSVLRAYVPSYAHVMQLQRRRVFLLCEIEVEYWCVPALNLAPLTSCFVQIARWEDLRTSRLPIHVHYLLSLQFNQYNISICPSAILFINKEVLESARTRGQNRLHVVQVGRLNPTY